MKSDFLIAVTQLAAERNLPREIVISAIEAALVSAYKKDSQAVGQNIKVKLDPASGEVRVDIMKTVVEEVVDPERDILLSKARKLVPDAEVGADIAVNTIVQSAGRIAAQTAKQVVMQRLREAERDLIYEEFSGKEGDVITATVQRMEARQIIVDIGRAEAIIPIQEQVHTERYRPGQKMKVYLSEVRRTNRGPEIVVSRSHKDLLKRLFEMEVPEIYSGAVEIMAIAREAGSRSKVAVRSLRDGVDPVGSCVGLRGIRIQNIVNELQGEKIDVIEWQKEHTELLANAISPAQVTRVQLNPEEGAALIVVPDRHLSLAIGREGQNARLAAKLTGWKIDIKSTSEVEDEHLIQPRAEVQQATDTLVVEQETTPVTVEPPVEEAAPEPVEEIPEEEEKVAAEVASEPEPLAIEVTAEEAEQEEVKESPSPEEELAAISLSEPDKPEKKKRVEFAAIPSLEKALSLDEVPEEIWAVPTAKAYEPGKLRFAEDIVGTRANKARERNSNKTDKAKTGGQKPKRGGKRVKVSQGDDLGQK